MKIKILNIVSFVLLAPMVLTAQIKDSISKLKVDHVLFLTNEPQIIIEQLQNVGLTLASKWETKHDGQGTTGNFFFFLNTYIEILGITNEDEAKKNEAAFGHNYTKRIALGNSKTGIGLVQYTSKFASFPIKTKVYKQTWMGKDSLLMALSNSQLTVPLFFIEPPSFANLVVDKLSDLDKYAEKNPEMKTYREHKLGLQKLTGIEIITTENTIKWGEALTYFKNFEGVTIAKGKSNGTILIFDNGKQQKQIDLSESIGLTIKY